MVVEHGVNGWIAHTINMIDTRTRWDIERKNSITLGHD